MNMAAPRLGSGGTPQGAMAPHFEEWVARQKRQIAENPLSSEEFALLSPDQQALLRRENRKPNISLNTDDDMFNRIINERMEKYKASLLARYMAGIRQETPPQDDGTVGQVVGQAASLAGFGDGFFGMIANFVSKIPVVGEYILAAIKWIGSFFGSMFNSDQKPMDFSEALQSVRDKNTFANGT
ncbi:MAG: hypothetical protein K2Q01_00765, partial [Rickettsiales bacterium]|nr:hypothetical protein [Rickettsiales bacterium]